MADITEPTDPAGFIYLASQSPRRRQLLDQIGVRHVLLLPGADEDAEALEVRSGDESPLHYVVRVTRLKLEAALARLERQGLTPAAVLCADTTVFVGERILGKPADAQEAVDTLTMLSGRSHQVATAVAMAWQGRTEVRLNVSTVCFTELVRAEIEAYVASGECFGKAGAYAIQSAAAAWISRIEGSYSGIMGLPLCEVAQLLRAFDLRSP
jgi:septum formation protein